MKTKRQRNRSKDRRASAVDRAERQKSGTRPYLNIPSGIQMYSFEKEGTQILDIMEYRVGKGNPNAKKGERFYERTFFTHRGIGPDEQTHICSAKTYGKKCSVCEHRTRLSRDPEDHQDEIDALKPTQRQLFAIKLPKKRKEKVRILEISNWFFGKELDAAIRQAKKKYKKARVDEFASSTNGMSVRCEIEEGSYQKRPHYKVKMAKLIPRKEQYDEDLVDEMPCLDELLKPTPYDELKELFMQTRDDDDDDDEEDEDDDDTDEDDDGDSEEGDDEEDADDDSEDEDEEDDGSDEDEDEDDDDSDDDEEDEDEEDDDDEDNEDDEVAVGTRVSFVYKGKKRKGKVKRLKGSLAYVKCEDRSSPYIQDLDDLKVLA